MKTIDALWILSKDGIPIADFCRDTNINKSLLSSAISAIRTFANTISGKELKSFQTGNSQFSCTKCLNDTAILVLKVSKETKHKEIEKICKILKKIFEDLYNPEDIKGWDGDLSFFDKFKQKLDLYFRVSNL
ncbi:MAG: hypothetical protein BAJALOKI3v1_210010 [Promethearchaeota archaeon]|nr:MAG: hypothetical protein BAJALOKI3v1_210010 [Candidatus Lokiarchaeota archaeon]